MRGENKNVEECGDGRQAPGDGGRAAKGQRVHKIDFDQRLIHKQENRDTALKDADIVARAVIQWELRRFEPVAVAIDRERDRAGIKKPPVAGGIVRPPAAPVSNSPAAMRALNQQASKNAADGAFNRMTSTRTDEAVFTARDRAAVGDFAMAFDPIWRAKNNLITAYRCRLTKDGKEMSDEVLCSLLDLPPTRGRDRYAV